MKPIRNLFFCLFLLSSSSCNDRFLNLQPLDQYADGAVWNDDPALIQAFINNIYRGLGQSGVRVSMSTYTDETMLTFGWAADNITRSLINPSDYGRFGNAADQSAALVWENVYKYVRACNVFFEKIESSKAVDGQAKEALKGEVYFLRAYLYHLLVFSYGGVPIVDKAYGLTDDFEVSRNTFKECIDFIVSDLDNAAQRINETDKGRPTKGAALALKSRVLLYAASELYNNASWANGYSNPEYLSYTDNNRSERWSAAKSAAKAVMDLGVYQLYKEVPGIGDDLSKNYGDIFLLNETSEDIFVKFYTLNIVSAKVMPNLNNGPNGYHLRGANTPIGQLVDAYLMADGTPFDWNNPEHAQNPYLNREPRFYASILYDGAMWRERPEDVRNIDPIGQIQTSFVERRDAAGNVQNIPGLDTRQSPSDDWNGSFTGYYLKKGIDPSIDAQFVPQTCPWRFIRYTEVVLNYAEACLELGEEEEAKTYLNKIRERVGLPEVTGTGQELIANYRGERRIELAFEDHRFFDVRRWMIARESYNNVQGIHILHKIGPNDNKESFYSVIPSVQDRAWHDKFYFLPIRLDEMNRNKALVQNPLY